MAIWNPSGSGSGAIWNPGGSNSDNDTERSIANYETRLKATGIKTPQPEETSNFLLTALDILDRPRNAITSGLAGKGFTKGLTGEVKTNVSDLLADIDNPIARGVAGFVGDVLLDPLTYVTLGTAGVAKGAAQQGAKKFLKFAGQPLADVTPYLDKAGDLLQRTGLPDKLGPIFSNNYVRRGLTSSADELRDVQQGVDVINQNIRSIPGLQKEAVEAYQKAYQGLSPEAAAQAANNIEAPVLLRKKQLQEIPKKLKRQAVVNQAPSSTFNDILSPFPENQLVKTGERNTKDALGIPEGKGMQSLEPTLNMPSLGETQALNKAKKALNPDMRLSLQNSDAMVGFEKMPLAPTLKDNIKTLFNQAKTGASNIDRDLLNKALKQLPVNAQKQLFEGIRVSIEKGKLPPKKETSSLLRQASIATRKAKLAEQGITPTSEMLTAAKKLGYELTPENIAATKIATKLTEETAKKDIQAGVRFNELPNYVRHLYTDDPAKVQAVLNEWAKKRASVPGKMAGYQKERKIPTIAEAKALGLNPIEDIRVTTTVRELEGIKQRATTTMYKDLEKLGENVVKQVGNAPAGWKTYPGIKELEGKAVHPEIARALERFNSTFNTDEGMRTLLTSLNTVQNVWKGLVTAPNPAFHVRNALGNAWNNFLAGVVNPEVYRLAAVVQKGGNEALELNGKQYTARELRTIFREQGLEGYGFFQGESSKQIIKQATEAFEQPKLTSTLNPVKQGRKFGDLLETNAKMAHFIDRVNKGDSFQEAAKSVRKYLFDYSDITQAEKSIRSFVPFYTFTRKNLPLQLENLITNPGKMTALYKFSENQQKAQGVKDSDMPDWLEAELAIPLGNKQYLNLDLPLSQLNMLGGGKTMANLAGMLTPGLKIPIELGMNKQFFSQAPIEKYPGATTQYAGMDLPAYLSYGLSQLGSVPRTAANIAGALTQQTAADLVGSLRQQPTNKNGTLPPAPRPSLIPLVQNVNPQRERELEQLERLRQLQDYVKYLEEVQKKDVKTLAELKKR